MTEIWLNYGSIDLVLDVMAENLGEQITSRGTILNDTNLTDKLSTVDMSKGTELAVLYDTPAVRQTISAICLLCEQRSKPIPRILADSKTAMTLKDSLPEGSSVSKMDGISIDAPNLVFISEIDLDGLFGFSTSSVKLLRQFGEESMLSAYTKRSGNVPTPGMPTKCMDVANNFADRFEIQSIEIAANSKGILDVDVGHPSKTSGLTKKFEVASSIEAEETGTLVVSTGKSASNETLSQALNSIWSTYVGVKNGGVAVLLAECARGTGSHALQKFVEGRMNTDRLKSPSKYIQGMEDLLYLGEIKKRIQIGLVSVLPEMYAKKLGIVHLDSAKHALEYLLKTRGQRQKVSVVSDGSRVLLRPSSTVSLPE
ncbi:MAG: hypothetical protein K8823_425 [Cenarchaeum symbiont of Oopsacas minuta]|nr:hypothetical protein [Cenarchaeum symbiont of Oopsacas minuta]